MLDVSVKAHRLVALSDRLDFDPPPLLDAYPDPELLTAEERAGALREVTARRNRDEAYLTALTGAAHAADDASVLRAGRTGTLVAAVTTCSTAAGSARVNVAKALADMPYVAAAFEAGDISYAHVQVIVALAPQIPLWDRIEDDVTTIAWCIDPGELRRFLQTLVEQCRPETLDELAEAAREKRKLSISELLDGSFKLDGRLDPIVGQKLADALAERTYRTGADDSRTAGQRRADALEELVADAQASTGPKGISDVSALIDADELPERLVGTLQDGTPLGPKQLEEFTCTAVVSLLAGNKTPNRFIPLAQAETDRLANRGLWKALIARDRGCINCGAAVRHCQAHHIIHWAHGGKTTLENMTLLCTKCHHELHQGHYRIDMINHIPVITPLSPKYTGNHRR